MLLAAIIILILLGLAIIAVGLRGRIVRHGPTCRACTFDLSGLATPLVTCPECGQSLALPRAVRPSLRRVSLTPLLSGAVLLLAIVGLMVAAGSGRLTSPAVQARLPQAVLRAEARFGGFELAKAALDEMLVRMSNNEVDQEALRAWALTALAIQADRHRAWLVGWGDIIVHARESGQLSDAQWAAYGMNGVSTELVVRTPVERAGTLRAFVNVFADRLGPPTRLSTLVHARVAGARVVGIPSVVESVDVAVPMFAGAQNGRLFRFAAPDVMGSGRAEIELELDVRWESDGRSLGYPKVMRTVSCPITIVERGQASVAAVRPAVDLATAVHASEFEVQDSITAPSLTGRLYVDSIPVPIACAAYIRLRGGQEVPWFKSVFRGNMGTSGGELRLPRTVFPGETVDLILKPDRETAEWAFDIHEYADTEIVIRDIPLTIAN